MYRNVGSEDMVSIVVVRLFLFLSFSHDDYDVSNKEVYIFVTYLWYMDVWNGHRESEI